MNAHSARGYGIDPIVYPWPKALVELPGSFEMRPREGIQCPSGAQAGIRLFRDEMRAEFGIALNPSARGRIMIAADQRLAREGYRLEVNEVCVRLEYGSPAGLIYGLDTLCSLVRRAERGRCIIPCCRVEDGPYKPMRGIHLYMPGRENIAFFKRLLRYLARLRLNTVFLEIGAGMEFKRHPEINAAWEKFARFAGPDNAAAEFRVQFSQGYDKDSVHPEVGGGSFLTQAEVRELAAEAAKYCIEIIPEVQSLSHAYWLCMPHPEIAERREDPFPDTYCPSNPASYRLLFDALEEVIAVFHPRMINIGHDEWYSIGLCPKCRRKPGPELYLSDVNKIAAFLKARGVQTSLWADKLLNFRGEDGKRYGGIAVRQTNPKTGFQTVRPATYEALEKMPRGILVGHWYYSLSRTIDRALIRNGLKFFYGNFGPTIFQNWPGRSRAPQCLGGEMSTWVRVSEPVFTATGQLPMLALGANMLWSRRADESAPVPASMRLGAVDSGAEKLPAVGQGSPAYRALGRAIPGLRRHIHGRPLPSECLSSRITPLKLDACCAMKAEDRLGGLAFDVKGVVRRFREHGLESHGVRFLFSQGASAAIGLALNSRDRVVVPMRGKVKSIVFLHALHARGAPAASYGNQDPDEHTVAVYRLVYADRCFVEQPVITCHTIGLLTGQFGVVQLARPFPAFPAWSDGRHTLYAYEWVNPYPGKTLARLVLEGNGASGGRYRLAPAGPRQSRGGVLVFAVSRVAAAPGK